MQRPTILTGATEQDLAPHLKKMPAEDCSRAALLSHYQKVRQLPVHSLDSFSSSLPPSLTLP